MDAQQTQENAADRPLHGSTLTGGEACTMIFRWFDHVACRWRLATADTDTLKPNTPYTVRDGKIAEVERGLAREQVNVNSERNEQ